MVAWHDIVLCDGNADTGQLGFNLNFTVPEATTEAKATESQKDAIRLFYQLDPEELSECQAHALLSCREYARICCETIFKAYPERLRRMLAPCLAAYVTSDPKMVSFATNWSERNFERGIGSPRVQGTCFFPDVEKFAAYLEGCMDMNGWSLEKLRQV